MKKEELVLDVEGMSCMHCVNSIKKAVESIEGIIGIEVSLEDKKVTVEYNPEKVKVQQIKLAIEDEGYDIK